MRERRILQSLHPASCGFGFGPFPRLSLTSGETKRVGRRLGVRGLGKSSRRPLLEAVSAHEPLQARYKRPPRGGSLLATNLDHQKVGRAVSTDCLLLSHSTPSQSSLLIL